MFLTTLSTISGSDVYTNAPAAYMTRYPPTKELETMLRILGARTAGMSRNTTTHAMKRPYT